jgi:hypothetical protein
MSGGGVVFDLRVYPQDPGHFHAVLTLAATPRPGHAQVFTGDGDSAAAAAHRAVEKWERYERNWR